MKRREFLKGSVAAATGVFGMPTLVSSTAVAKAPSSPNDKINIAQIGCGRIARSMDLPGVLRHDLCRVVATADVDIKRARDGKKLIEDFYERQKGNRGYVDVKVYQDYREMLRDESIDAVVISTPDHWHARPTAEAALLSKDVFLQKPAALTIAEGRMMSDIVNRTGCVFQLGSQQRANSPWPQFKWVCELVRNGAIGQVKHIEIGLPTDPSGRNWPEMPVPENLNYDMWLGSTPVTPYTENRVHPQNGYGRPGWLRVEAYGAGMITGWGTHHVDTAHWGMGTEYTGPVEIEGTAEFPQSGLWDVHGPYDIRSKYANGVTMHISDKHPNGVRFIGEEGWIFVSRGSAGVTASDPTSGDPNTEALRVSDPKILQMEIGSDGIHLYECPDIHLDWLRCIRTRRQAVVPVEVAHRSCSACLIYHIAMKLPGTLHWDPRKERFIDNDQANAMLSRLQRAPYGLEHMRI